MVRRDGERGAVLPPERRGGGQRGQRLRGGSAQPHDPEGDAGGRGDDAGGAGGQSGQRGRHGERGAVQLPARRGGGQRGQRLRGGLRQPHDPEGDAGGRGDDAGGAGGQLRAARTGRGARRGSTTPRGVAVDSAGNVYVADTDNHTIRKVTPAGVVTTLAGLAGSYGQRGRDGERRAVLLPDRRGGGQRGQRLCGGLRQPHDPEGDAGGRGDDAGGAGGQLGSADGTGSAARFYYPIGVAVDSAGNVYVADSGNHTIRKVTPSGVVTTLAGLAGSSGARTGRGAPRGSTTRAAWRWTARATSTWRTRTTTRSGR